MKGGIALPKKNKPKKDVLVTHKDDLKEVSIKPHKDKHNLKGHIKENKKGQGLSLSFKLDD